MALDHPIPSPALGDVETGRAFLALLGERARRVRMLRGMSRKSLARDAMLSERYIAQFEGGRANISIMLLRQIAMGLHAPIEALVVDGAGSPPELSRAMDLLRGLPAEQVERAYRMLANAFAGGKPVGRQGRIALIGLRGAGKSTLGALVAAKLAMPFVELNKEIEQESGMALSTLFDLYGQPGFRRLERRCLDRLFERRQAMVIATGGGLVSEPATFERLLANCYTVWIKAPPAVHMQRVMGQGDMRPMAHAHEAMADLRQILKAQEPLYRRADVVFSNMDADVNDAAGELSNLIATMTKPPPWEGSAVD